MACSSRSAGQSIEAVDSLGYWHKATIVGWLNEGDVIGSRTQNTTRPNVITASASGSASGIEQPNETSCEIDDDEVGPGYEVNFDGWNNDYNRVIRDDTEIRDVTDTSGDKRNRRKKEANVKTLRLHRDDERTVEIDGQEKLAVMRFIDPIKNTISAIVDGECILLCIDNFQKSVQSDDEDCVTKPRKQVKKRKLQHVLNEEAQPDAPTRGACTTHLQLPGNQQTDPGHYPLPLLLADSFFEVGEVCSFKGVVVAVIASIKYDNTAKCLSALCLPCTLQNEVVNGVEPGCEIKCRPDQLCKLKTSLKHSNGMKVIQTKLRTQSLTASVTISDITVRTLARKLRLGFMLREACRDIIKGKALKKVVTTLLDPLDMLIFNFDAKQCALFSVEDDLSMLDDLMGLRWDVDPSTPNDHFCFIRSISVSATPLRMMFVLLKAKSIHPFAQNYRELAVASLRSARDVMPSVMLGEASTSASPQ